MSNLKSAAIKAIKTHGSLRKAAAATGVNYSLLSMLASGTRTTASVETLTRLGIEKRITHRRINGRDP